MEAMDNCNESNAAVASDAKQALECKRARSAGAADARTSLCTYCHAPLAPGMQAIFALSPLFRVRRSCRSRRLSTRYLHGVPGPLLWQLRAPWGHMAPA